MSDIITYRTNDGTRWGAGKGANLTPTEVDRNFWSVHQRLLTIENNPVLPLEIAEITVVGNQMTITLSDGYTTFGPFTLPTAAFDWVGEWTPSTNYAAYTLFTYNDVLYMTLEALNTGPSFVMGPHYQYLMPLPRVFDVALFFPQKVGFAIPAGEPIMSYLSVRDWYLLANLPLSRASLRVATTAELVLDIYKNTTSIGTITFAAATTVGVFSFADTVEFEAGDVLSVMAPAAVDDTAKDLRCTFVGRQGTP